MLGSYTRVFTVLFFVLFSAIKVADFLIAFFFLGLCF